MSECVSQVSQVAHIRVEPYYRVRLICEVEDSRLDATDKAALHVDNRSRVCVDRAEYQASAWHSGENQIRAHLCAGIHHRRFGTLLPYEVDKRTQHSIWNLAEVANHGE